MSSTEIHFGKIKVHTRNTQDTLNYIKEHGLEKDFEIEPPGTAAWKTWWSINPKDEVRKKYVVLNSQAKNSEGELCLCEFENHIEWGEDNETSYIHDEGNDTFSFVTEFYNGGTCLEEVLEYLLKL